MKRSGDFRIVYKAFTENAEIIQLESQIDEYVVEIHLSLFLTLQFQYKYLK